MRNWPNSLITLMNVNTLNFILNDLSQSCSILLNLPNHDLGHSCNNLPTLSCLILSNISLDESYKYLKETLRNEVTSRYRSCHVTLKKVTNAHKRWTVVTLNGQERQGTFETECSNALKRIVKNVHASRKKEIPVKKQLINELITK